MSDCERPEFYHETFPVAHKRHRCVECLVWIEPGDHYVKCVGKWDGEVSINPQHWPCYHISRFVNLELKLDSEGCIEFGGVREALNNYTQYDDEDNTKPFGVEQMVDIEGHWGRWLSGVKEVFNEGTGI